MRAQLIFCVLVLTQPGCPDSRSNAGNDSGSSETPDADSGSSETPDADVNADGSDVESGSPDAGPPVLPPYDRTLVTRALMPTSPQNLLRDPLIGGEGTTSYGQVRAFFVGGASIPLRRTFQSVSPVGGAVSIEELRDIPRDAGAATTARVMSSFLGGSGDFNASIWVS